MTVSAVASAGLSAVPGAGARAVDPAYGLAFRFTVKIDGLDLGSWQSCSGLKVDFKPAEMKTGGAYIGSRYLPGELVFAKLVLRRAALAKHSQVLQDWLQTQASGWVTSDAPEEHGGTGVITLYDSNDEPTLWWQLEGVRPAAWSGPDLDANTSKVALETLELVHGGFVVGTGPPPQAPPSDAVAPAALTLEGPGGSVPFGFPPTEIVLQMSQMRQGLVQQGSPVTTGGQAAASQGQTLEANTNRPNHTTYKINNLVLHGTDTKPHADLMTAWATRPEGAPRGSDTLPPLTFTWGAEFNAVPVRLQALTVTYTRFSAQGKPVRAKVALTLEVRTTEQSAGAPGAHQGARNPSSGGVPGRAAHVVLQGDSLPAIAQVTYADAGHWRDIASANDVDDPLRVRPGTSLLLPAPQEVAR
jgi:phage tail-like protein